MSELAIVPERPTCPPKPALEDRPLIGPDQAGDLMAIFKVLANDTRLRLLHALAKAGELCVTDLADAVGMTPQAVSNQLQRLVDRDILRSRRDGNNMRYQIINRCVPALLQHGLCLMECTESRHLMVPDGPRPDRR